MAYKIDLHVHTNKSNDGVHKLAKLIQAAKKAGLDAIAITDHDIHYDAYTTLNADILIIPGCEVSTQDGHMVVLFCHTPLDMAKLMANGLPRARDLAAQVHADGGIIIAAHPFHKPGRFEQKPDFYEYVDGIEAANARAYFKNPQANAQALQYAKAHGLFTTGGSDAHSQYEVGNAYTLVEAPELSLDSIKNALLSGHCQAVLKQNSPRRRKGIAMFYKACRSKKPANIAKAITYLGYCLMMDIAKK